MTVRHAPLLFIPFAFLIFSLRAEPQSLADAARHQQTTKKAKAARVYTNDDLPLVGTISVVGSQTPPPPAKSEGAGSEPGEQAAKAEAPDAQAEREPAANDRAKAGQDLKSNAAEIKKEVAQLERELDVLEREFRLRSATYYADAGNSLRDPKYWAEQQRQYETQVSEKKKALEAAKQKLGDLEMQARRAGLSLE